MGKAHETFTDEVAAREGGAGDANVNYISSRRQGGESRTVVVQHGFGLEQARTEAELAIQDALRNGTW